MTDNYQTGETLRITAVITDVAGAAATPSAIVISIQKPDGTLDIDSVAMSITVVGTYYYDYAIPAGIGTYKAQVTVTGSGGRITIDPDRFLVESAI